MSTSTRRGLSKPSFVGKTLLHGNRMFAYEVGDSLYLQDHMLLYQPDYKTF